jgi:hypothetical protein
MDAIIHLLKDTDTRVVANAIEALEALGNPKAVESVISFISHADNRVRERHEDGLTYAHNNALANSSPIMDRLKGHDLLGSRSCASRRSSPRRDRHGGGLDLVSDSVAISESVRERRRRRSARSRRSCRGRWRPGAPPRLWRTRFRRQGRGRRPRREAEGGRVARVAGGAAKPKRPTPAAKQLPAKAVEILRVRPTRVPRHRQVEGRREADRHDRRRELRRRTRTRCRR